MLYNAVFVASLPPLLLCACVGSSTAFTTKNRHRLSEPLRGDTRFLCVDLNVIYYVIGHSKVPIPYQD